VAAAAAGGCQAGLWGVLLGLVQVPLLTPLQLLHLSLLLLLLLLCR
jgi:hypothetical protein